MTGHVAGLRADNRQIVGTLDLEHLVAGPLAVLPGPHLPGELAEVDFRVKVGREVLAVATGIDIDDVDFLDAIEVLVDCNCGVGVDHTRVKAHTQDSGNALLGAQFLALPLVVGVPRRGFTDLVRLFVNGGIQVGRTGFDAGLQYRHIDESRSDIDHQLRLCLVNQRLGRLDIEGIQGMGLQFTGNLEAALFLHAVDDGLTLLGGTRRDMDVTQHVIVLGAFVCDHLSHTTGTNNQNVFLHFSSSKRLLGKAG